MRESLVEAMRQVLWASLVILGLIAAFFVWTEAGETVDLRYDVAGPAGPGEPISHQGPTGPRLPARP